MSEKETCPLCKRGAHRTAAPDHHNCYQYSGCACPPYYIGHHDLLIALNNPQEREKHKPDQIRALLRERFLKGLRPPFLQFSSGPYPDMAGADPVRVQDLLATWPDGIPERIDRSFVNLINSMYGWSVPGQLIEFRDDYIRDFTFFTDNRETVAYFKKAMGDYGWIETRKNSENLCVTPKGWAKYDELTRSRSNVRNPAFVAMWFGGKTQIEEMNTLFERAISPAIRAAGYLVKRADTDDHNEPIMDQIVADIRVAPFVVAELTNNNPGVYYEAGYARGLGTTVIYCSHNDLEPHFDVSGVNHVKWSDSNDLRNRLKVRILGTLGQGAHRVDDDRGAPNR